MKKIIKTLSCVALLAATAPSQASTITFDFTGRLVVAGPVGDPLINNELPYTPIAASLTYNTVTGVGDSKLSITMTDSFLGVPEPAVFHDITMTRQAGSNLIDGQVLVDWSGTFNMPMHVEWDATGLLNAIKIGLVEGDVLSGSTLYHDTNRNGVQDAGESGQNIFSATPYSDTIQNPLYVSLDPNTLQGPAPLAATSNSLGLDDTTPFPGFRGYLDIGSGNSMHVTSVSAVPVPAAVWLFGSGLIGLAGFARRKQA